jgi:hypothetical protein
MEGRVFVCSWKKVGNRFRVWVKNRPKLAAEADSFEAADEELWSVIIRATDDGENTREYDPPAPAGAEVAAFLTPPLVVVVGNERATLRSEMLFAGERCAQCGRPSGPRTAEPLASDDIDSSSDAGFAVIRHRPYGNVTAHYFSEGFLDLLTPEERARFEWRKVERPARAKKAFYELVASGVHVRQAGVRDLPEQREGWRCDRCGVARLPYYTREGWPSRYVCAADLPDPLPSCFTVGEGSQLNLCFRLERWRELVGQKGAKGLLSNDVGVVGDERCEREPKVRMLSESGDGLRLFGIRITRPFA